MALKTLKDAEKLVFGGGLYTLVADEYEAIPGEAPLDRCASRVVRPIRGHPHPRKVPRRVIECLRARGIETAADLGQISAPELFALPQVGQKTLEGLCIIARKAGVSVRDGPSEPDEERLGLTVRGQVAQVAKHLSSGHTWATASGILGLAILRLEDELIHEMRRYMAATRAEELERVEAEIRRLEERKKLLEAEPSA